jgi:hypothetical protein
MTRLNITPTIVVHKSRSTETLDSRFWDLNKRGCKIVQAPSFRRHPLGDYPCRNEVGSLIEFAKSELSQQRPILFCEADMIFVRPIHYSGQLAGEYYGYLNYDNPRILRAANKCGISWTPATMNKYLSIGVPYFFPSGLVGVLGGLWLNALDSFDELQWIDLMYAFGLAVAQSKRKDCGDTYNG